MYPPPNRYPAKLLDFAGQTRQYGTALITALLATAIAASMAVVLLGKVDRWIDRIAINRDKGQSSELARAGLDYARGILIADARHAAVDTLEDDWARVLPPLRMEGGKISGHIEDVQRRLNLNNLRRDNGVIDARAFAAYLRLLAVLGLPEELAATLADWLDADDSPREGGAETAYYRQQGGEGASNRPLEHIGNLYRIKGYTSETISRLKPFVSVLPGQQAININTAPPEILYAIQPGLSLSGARELARTRQGAYFRDEADFRNRLPESNLPSALIPVTAASHHFQIHIETMAGHGRSRLDAMVERYADGSRSRIAWIKLQ